MNKETKEEYLETLYKLSSKEGKEKIKTSEIAEDLSISSPSVTEILPKLEQEGYIIYQPYHGVELTDKGRKEGRKIVRTHRVLEVFLDEFFDISDDKMHEKACELEHIFDMEMIDEICERMGAPSVCPHGNEIPSCPNEDCPVIE
ncbi:MAG: metal-dependent transcriptional regulator [Candidatus Thermoplasmatota archaeon]|nr:metal-dependent transcriptional regulator [Candidatus Thermoplasmatota archaeon]MBS3789462.1 metal-dependent transcriptional regulator [Candidatus Thermoplasmatota archaeon]